jgi:hypothetical protein
VSKLNTEARWGDLILFKINPDTQSHLTHSSCWEWDHVGLVVLSQSEFSHDQETEMIDDPNPSLDLLELTSEGVTLYPLTGRLRSYNYQNVSFSLTSLSSHSRILLPSWLLSMFAIWDYGNFVDSHGRRKWPPN